MTEQIVNTDLPKSLDDYSFEQLLTYTKNLKNKKKKYIRKYQLSDKGKIKVKEASKRHYDKHREKILAKKKEQYQLKKLSK